MRIQLHFWVYPRESTRFSLPYKHHFMKAEHRKYWLKVIVVPREGLKGAGIAEKQLTPADCSEGQGSV